MQIVIIAIVVILGAGAVWLMSSNDTAETVRTDENVIVETITPETDANVQADSETTTTEPTDGVYADGTYTKTGTYVSPAGKEDLEVSLTISNDVVTGVAVTGFATNPGSVNNQKKFNDGIEAAVVGKSIDSINLTVVNGSSLTPAGFMDALELIKAEAMQS